MRYLIRFITRNAAGGVEHHDKIIEAPALTMGRATDQLLHLRDRRVRLQHAQIERRNGAVHIRTGNLAGVVVNGRSQRDTALQVDDVIEIGSNILRVIAAPDDVDFALSFELAEDASTEHFAAAWSAPVAGVGGWSKRRMAWTLVAVVAVVALLMPGLSLISPDVASTVRGRVVPDDSFWLAGPLHTGHSTIGSECEACHVNAFERVPDAACMDCHEVSVHVSRVATTVLGETRCASCHREHNEPAELVNRHQGLCADCHAALPAAAELAAAEDFLDAHPEFRISLLLPTTTADNSIEWNVEHRLLSEAQGADRSNLSFDHAVHLDPAGIVAPAGRRTMECAECHEPEPGGAAMLPIAMDEHCSDCHALNFDPDDPDRVVPHGDAQAVVQALVEYYSARLLGADADDVEQRLRRPGRQLTRADRDRAAAEARVRALAVAADIFERRTCANCHEVTRSDDAELPWSVLPVRLTDSFFPHANFSHAAHDTEVTSCDSCHNATASTTAEDVLIPDLESCRDCHGSSFAGRNEPGQIPSTCIMCHSFHFDAKGLYP